MISIEMLVAEVAGLQRGDLQRWIDNGWIRPDGVAGTYSFMDIDMARVRLIRELLIEVEINETALPVVLLLIDQLHDLRRRLRELGRAIEQTTPDDARMALLQCLAKT